MSGPVMAHWALDLSLLLPVVMEEAGGWRPSSGFLLHHCSALPQVPPTIQQVSSPSCTGHWSACACGIRERSTG